MTTEAFAPAALRTEVEAADTSQQAPVTNGEAQALLTEWLTPIEHATKHGSTPLDDRLIRAEPIPYGPGGSAAHPRLARALRRRPPILAGQDH